MLLFFHMHVPSSCFAFYWCPAWTWATSSKYFSVLFLVNTHVYSPTSSLSPVFYDCRVQSFCSYSCSSSFVLSLVVAVVVVSSPLQLWAFLHFVDLWLPVFLLSCHGLCGACCKCIAAITVVFRLSAHRPLCMSFNRIHRRSQKIPAYHLMWIHHASLTDCR